MAIPSGGDASERLKEASNRRQYKTVKMSDKVVIFNSLDEISRVMDSLNSLVHYPKDFKEFGPEYLELIGSNLSSVACSVHLHPGRSCTSYVSYKLNR